MAEEKKVNKEVVKETKNNLENIVEQLKNSDDDLFTNLASILSLPDEQFDILAPGILQSYQQTMNRPNERLLLAQTFNAQGIHAEDILEASGTINEAIDQMPLSSAKRDFFKQILNAIGAAISETEGISKRIIPIAIELCHPNAKIPQYAHESDSGADIYALDDITVKPGETVLVPTGLKVGILPGYELQVRPKSGRAAKTKLRIANTPGTIDQEYRDEIKVIIENIEPPIKDITIDDEGRVTSILHGSDFTIGKGEKFAQLVLSEVPKASYYRVEHVSVIDGDRQGGFGSSGLK